MTGAMPRHWLAPASGSWLARLFDRQHHPEEFRCAVRVLEGTVPGESGRWRYRWSAADPLVLADAVVTLNHGSVGHRNGSTLRLRFDATVHRAGPPVEPGHLVWPATELGSGARVEVAADAAEAARFYVPGPEGLD